MAEAQSPNAKPTEATPLAWAMDRPPQKGPEYYKKLKGQFVSFIKGNELLPGLSLMETVNTHTISLLMLKREN